MDINLFKLAEREADAAMMKELAGEADGAYLPETGEAVGSAAPQEDIDPEVVRSIINALSQQSEGSIDGADDLAALAQENPELLKDLVQGEEGPQDDPEDLAALAQENPELLPQDAQEGDLQALIQQNPELMDQIIAAQQQGAADAEAAANAEAAADSEAAADAANAEPEGQLPNDMAESAPEKDEDASDGKHEVDKAASYDIYKKSIHKVAEFMFGL